MKEFYGRLEFVEYMPLGIGTYIWKNVATGETYSVEKDQMEKFISRSILGSITGNFILDEYGFVELMGLAEIKE